MNEYYNYNTNGGYNTNGMEHNGFYQPEPEPQKKVKKKSSGKKVAAMALCFSLLGGAVGTGGTYLGMNYLNKDSSQAASADSSESDKTVIYSTDRKTAEVAQTATTSST